MHILNPISRIRIPLPSQSTLLLPPEDHTFPEELIAQNQQRTVRERYQSFITKVVLSCSPVKKGSDCVALAIYGWSDNKLAYARPGDAAWTILSWDWRQFTYKWGPLEDAVYYKGQFYVVNLHGTVMRCSIPPVGSAEEPLVEVIAFGIPYDDLIWGNSTYLVEHQGSLLQVLRKRRPSKKSRPDKPLLQYLTFGFHVFRLDPSSSAWEMIESLGDGALFLGRNTSVSVSATDLRWCKGNCIYFTDGDDLSPWSAISLGGRGAGRDTGYCTLKDWEVHYLDQVASYSPSSPPIWVLPSAGEG
ncbi:putative F-box protein [Ananas comosus]|uniref:Putative F-box protein n=1 Tax=Ananas comosus TaxID=4615 RepID=A0A199VB70_ANACO|nr:putative F-box protein [Ananas comosus]